MISTLIVESDGEAMYTLENLLSDNCPQVNVCGKTRTYKGAFESIEVLNPDLVFLEVDILHSDGLEIFNLYYPSNFEVIVTAETEKHAVYAFQCCASGYLIKPIRKDELITTVHNASQRIKAKREELSNKSLGYPAEKVKHTGEVIGIPTIEGYEFIPVKDIIRCEGMQKCTRIITVDKTDMISSYNLGEFRKLLDRYGFYSPHKSHLINLNMVRKYHREGSIYMLNGSCVPVAKRKKKEFLKQIKHI